jgi:DNA mismatch endonuclease (patch repair protein)
MAAIRSRGNRTTERRLRAVLVRAGLRGWSVGGAREIGSPDFTFKRRRIAVFVDGCFFHGCPRCGHVPRTNTEYWAAKIARNRRRDRLMGRIARSRGYTVVRVWECELRRRRDACLDRIVRAHRDARRAANAR